MWFLDNDLLPVCRSCWWCFNVKRFFLSGRRQAGNSEGRERSSQSGVQRLRLQLLLQLRLRLSRIQHAQLRLQQLLRARLVAIQPIRSTVRLPHLGSIRWIRLQQLVCPARSKCSNGWKKQKRICHDRLPSLRSLRVLVVRCDRCAECFVNKFGCLNKKNTWILELLSTSCCWFETKIIMLLILFFRLLFLLLSFIYFHWLHSVPPNLCSLNAVLFVTGLMV